MLVSVILLSGLSPAWDVGTCPMSLTKSVGTACNPYHLAGMVCYGHFQPSVRQEGQQHSRGDKQHHCSAHLKEYVFPECQSTLWERWKTGREVGQCFELEEAALQRAWWMLGATINHLHPKEGEGTQELQTGSLVGSPAISAGRDLTLRRARIAQTGHKQGLVAGIVSTTMGL